MNNGIPNSNKNERSVRTCTNMDEIHKCDVEQKANCKTRTYCIAQGTILSVVTYNGKESERECGRVYIAKSLCFKTGN